MIEQRVESDLQIAAQDRGSLCRNRNSKKFFFLRRVMTRKTLHRQNVFAEPSPNIHAAVRPRRIALIARYIPAKAGKHLRQSHHIQYSST